MRKSRLNLFKATSMTISLLGMILIVLFVGIIAYIGVAGISSKVSSNVDSGSAYDQLAALNSEYSALQSQYSEVKAKASVSGNKKVKKDYVNAELELVKANSSIGDVQSALSTNLPADEVKNRLNIATIQLKKAKTSLSTVEGEF